MSILPIIEFPNPLLKKTSLPVEKINQDLHQLLNNMLETMYQERGIGLAAVQVGVLKRILVIDITYQIEGCNEEDHSNDYHHNHIINKNPLFLINPEIIFSSKEKSIYHEGCLSFSEIRADISRPREVKVKYLNYDGQEQVLEASGLLATCIQHEIDHLNGITFIDHLSKLKQEMAIKKLKKISRQ